MVLTRQKARAGANPEYPAKNQPGTNIHEVRTPRRTVFTQEQNELFIQQVLQLPQEEKDDELHYHVLGLNDSSTEYSMKKPNVPWLFDFTLTKISIHKFLM